MSKGVNTDLKTIHSQAILFSPRALDNLMDASTLKVQSLNVDILNCFCFRQLCRALLAVLVWNVRIERIAYGRWFKLLLMLFFAGECADVVLEKQS